MLFLQSKLLRNPVGRGRRHGGLCLLGLLAEGGSAMHDIEASKNKPQEKKSMTPEDAHLLKALYDEVANVAAELETKWGVDRLPRLVTPELRARWAMAQERPAEALIAAWCFDERMVTKAALDDARDETVKACRAWRALDKEATALGKPTLAPDVWEIALDDGSVAIFAKDYESGAATRQGRAAVVWTLPEIAALIQALPELVTSCKTHFPGSVVVPKSRGKVANDPIPFFGDDGNWHAGSDE